MLQVMVVDAGPAVDPADVVSGRCVGCEGLALYQAVPALHDPSSALAVTLGMWMEALS